MKINIVSRPVIFESDGANYLLDEDSLDELGEEMSIFGTIFVYSIFCSTLCFQMYNAFIWTPRRPIAESLLCSVPPCTCEMHLVSCL